MRRFVAWIAALVFIAIPAAFADDIAPPEAQARHDLAQQIVALTTGGQVMQSVIGAVWPTEEQQLRRDNPDVSQDAIDSLKATMTNAVTSMMTELMGPVTDTYAQQFTADELRALLAFYQSPLGAKVLATAPVLLKQIMPTLVQREQQLLPQIMQQLMQAARQKGLKVIS